MICSVCAEKIYAVLLLIPCHLKFSLFVVYYVLGSKQTSLVSVLFFLFSFLVV